MNHFNVSRLLILQFINFVLFIMLMIDLKWFIYQFKSYLYSFEMILIKPILKLSF